MWRRWLSIAAAVLVVALLGWWIVSVGRLSGDQRSAESTFGQFVLAGVMVLFGVAPVLLWVWRNTARPSQRSPMEHVVAKPVPQTPKPAEQPPRRVETPQPLPDSPHEA